MKFIKVLLFIIYICTCSYGQNKETLTKPEPNDSLIAIYESKADLNIRNSKFSEAADDYSKIIKKYPSSTKYIFKRGMMYVAGKHYNKAKEDFNTLIALGTDNIAEVYFYRGLCKIMDQNGSINPDGCNDIAKSKEMGFKADLTGFQYL